MGVTNPTSRRSRGRVMSVVAAVLAAASVVMVPAATSVAGASGTMSALIYGPSVIGGSTSLEAQLLANQGWTVSVVDQTTWDAMTVGQFASYQLLVLGDPQCSTSSHIAGAVTNESTWRPAVDGNIFISGNDPAFHYVYGNNSAGTAIFDAHALAYAGSKPGATGLYLSLSCYGSYADSVLNGIEAGFSASGGGNNDVGLTAAGLAALNGTTEANLSNWGESVHTVLESWPADFTPFAVANTTRCTTVVTTPSNKTGCVFMVGRGSLYQAGAPRALSLVRSGTTMTATWLPGPSVSPYLCTLMLGFGSPTGFTVRTSATSCTFYGLSVSTPYGVKVAGASGVGTAASAWAAAGTTITCVRGRVVRHLTGFPAVCPAGFRQRH